jgi:hypothetical protein
MKLRTGKEIGYEISRGVDYILFSVNDWRALKKKEKRDIFMEVIDKFGCKFVMTATEYYPYFDTGTFRINERTFPKVFEMYYLKGMEREEFPYKIELKFERDVDC